MHISEARALLIPRAELLGDRMSGRQLAEAVAKGELQRIDHGYYVPDEVWRAAYPDGRHLLRVVAADSRRAGGDGVSSHISAATLHGLPLVRVEPKRVHLSSARSAGVTRASAIARHQVAVLESDIVMIDGILATSLARTVADVLRTESAATGLAIADAALRKVAWDQNARTYDEAAAEALCEEVASHLPSGGRGVLKAMRVLELADGRAESPGESLSRMYLLELGFAPPRLQVLVRAPGGGYFYVDFGLDDADALGEFDGEVKYTDPRYLAGRTMQQAILDEKKREDWIRGTMNCKFPRWGWVHIESAETLGRRLAAFQVYAPGRR